MRRARRRPARGGAPRRAGRDRAVNGAAPDPRRQGGAARDRRGGGGDPRARGDGGRGRGRGARACGGPPGRRRKRYDRALVSTRTTSARGPFAARFIAAGTYARIVLAPVIMGLVLAGSDAEGPAAILFAFAPATGWWDGRLAPPWNLTSQL